MTILYSLIVTGYLFFYVAFMARLFAPKSTHTITRQVVDVAMSRYVDSHSADWESMSADEVNDAFYGEND